ncbi:MAG: hypothetical protein M1398_05780, partial [Deltaproteobacteria bacterium]|nr:hypothetical protein [Deltaproteobacteria bacterium]
CSPAQPFLTLRGRLKSPAENTEEKSPLGVLCALCGGFFFFFLAAVSLRRIKPANYNRLSDKSRLLSCLAMGLWMRLPIAGRIAMVELTAVAGNEDEH